MTYRTVTEFSDGDYNVTLQQDEESPYMYRVAYGYDIHEGIGLIAAAHRFGECVMHSLACASKLETIEGDDVVDAIDEETD